MAIRTAPDRKGKKEKYVLPSEHPSLIDPEIRGLVAELNKHGIKTLSSCAGHKGSLSYPDRQPTPGRGYIVIKGKHLNTVIEQICSKHGCQNLRVRDTTLEKGKEETTISFKPVGEDWNDWSSKRPDGWCRRYYKKGRRYND